MKNVRKILAAAFMSVLLGLPASPHAGACASTEMNSGNVTLQKESAIVISKELGRIEVNIYAGRIAGGKFCVLTVYSQEFSGDGIFNIQFLDTRGEQSTGSGKLPTLRGADDATIWECHPESGKESCYFVHDAKADTLFWIVNEVSASRAYPLPLAFSKIIELD